ncbi:MAG: hypothetical protein QW431_02045 [Conexivisphaerales archaeon]
MQALRINWSILAASQRPAIKHLLADSGQIWNAVYLEEMGKGFFSTMHQVLTILQQRKHETQHVKLTGTKS